MYVLNSFGSTCNCYLTQYAGASQEFVVPEYNYAGYLPYDNFNGKTCKTYLVILSRLFSTSVRDCFVCFVSPCCFRTRPENFQGVGQKETVALQSWSRANQQVLKVTYFVDFAHDYEFRVTLFDIIGYILKIVRINQDSQCRFYIT